MVTVSDPTKDFTLPEHYTDILKRQIHDLRWISFLSTPERSEAIIEILFPKKEEVLEIVQKDQKTFFNATMPDDLTYDVRVRWVPVTDEKTPDHVKPADVIITERLVGGMAMTEIDFSELDAFKELNTIHRPWVDRMRILITLLENNLSPTLGTIETGNPHAGLKPERNPS